MAFVAEDVIQALRARGTEVLPVYEAALREACTAHPPPFGQAWYGDRYRAVASDPMWLAFSLVANAEKAKRVVARLVRDFPREHEPCPIGSDRALDNAIITAPEARDPQLLQKLDAVAGRILRQKA